jgi:hypothetical protein
MGAEFVVLLVIGGACYVALRPLRRALERRILRWRGRRAGRVVSLVRNSDGTYTPPTRKKNDGDER